MKKKALSLTMALVMCAVLILNAGGGVCFAAGDFPDAPRSAWYGEAVYICVDKGYVRGLEDGTFHPDDPITYAQIASMLRGGVYAGTSYAKQTFPNMPWWYPGIYTCRQAGALEGIAAACDSIDVNTSVTRCEVALIVSNVIKTKGLSVSDPERQAASGRISDWSAVPANYKDAVASCYALGILNGNSDGSFGGQRGLTRAEVCAIMVRMDAVIANPPADAKPSGVLGSKSDVAYGTDAYPDLTDTGGETYRTLDADKSTYFYNFRTNWQAGACVLEDASLRDDAPGFFGITASADRDVVTYKTYSELDNAKVRMVQLRVYGSAEYETLDNSGQFSVKDLPNGPYRLCVWFDYTQENGAVEEVSTWKPIYVSSGSAYFADTIRHGGRLLGYTRFHDSTIEEWLAENSMRFVAGRQLQDWIAKHGGSDLEAALRLDHVTYPFYSDTEQYPNDAPKWRALAHEICPDETTGDFTKAYLVHEWMSHNLVYDLRQIANPDGSDRPRNLNYRWGENGGGEWTTWNTHIGVCYDFANIYAIMCRELGVPCRVLYDERINHTLNVVYLNNHWEIVDLTFSVKSYYIENTKAALQKFWDTWEGPGTEAERSEGFIISVPEYGWYKVYADEGDVTIMDKMSGIHSLDKYLSTKALLQGWGNPQYNH